MGTEAVSLISPSNDSDSSNSHSTEPWSENLRVDPELCGSVSTVSPPESRSSELCGVWYYRADVWSKVYLHGELLPSCQEGKPGSHKFLSSLSGTRGGGGGRRTGSFRERWWYQEGRRGSQLSLSDHEVHKPLIFWIYNIAILQLTKSGSWSVL